MKKISFAAVFSVLTLSTSAFAGGIEVPSNQTGLYVGIGGSYNSISFYQFIEGAAASNVIQGGVVVATGQAGGISFPSRNNQSSFAPDVQLGYFQHFSSSDYLWGAKFSYQYLGTSFTQGPIDSPQSGTFTTVSGPNSFTGNAIIRTSQNSINNEFLFLAYLGHSFTNSSVYLGVGPALFGTISKYNNATGYANINGNRMDVSGAPLNFSNSPWIWGGAAQVGATYYLSTSWFVDANYTYGFTGDYVVRNTSPFTNTNTSAGYNTTGTMVLRTTRQLSAQSLSVSINKILW